MSSTFSDWKLILDDSTKYLQFPACIDSYPSINIKSTTNEEPILSNFYPCCITVPEFENRIFNSIEHAYQYSCAKFFREEKLAEDIFASKSASQAKSLASKLKWHKKNMFRLAQKWNSKKVQLMSELLARKAECCEEFHDRLIATYPHPLVHNVYDSFWGTITHSGEPGMNIFSDMLMELRSRLIFRCMVKTKGSIQTTDTSSSSGSSVPKSSSNTSLTPNSPTNGTSTSKSPSNSSSTSKSPSNSSSTSNSPSNGSSTSKSPSNGSSTSKSPSNSPSTLKSPSIRSKNPKPFSALKFPSINSSSPNSSNSTSSVLPSSSINAFNSMSTSNTLSSSSACYSLPSRTSSGLMAIQVKRDGTFTPFSNDLQDFNSFNVFSLLPRQEFEEPSLQCDKCVNNTLKKSGSETNTEPKSNSLYSFHINVLGRQSQLKVNKKHITRFDVHNHISKLKYFKRIPNKYVIKCNGLFKFKKMYPSDKICIEVVGLLGGGRGRKKSLHGGQPCPGCFICKRENKDNIERYTHISRMEENHPNFVMYVTGKYPEIKGDSCICRACERKLVKELESKAATHKVDHTLSSPPSKKVRVGECAVKILSSSECTGKLCKIRPEWSADTIGKALSKTGELVPDEISFLCKKHYSIVYDYVENRKTKCSACKVWLDNKRNASKRKYKLHIDISNDEELLTDLMSIACEIFSDDIILTKDSHFCYHCFQKFQTNEKVFKNPKYHESLLKDIAKSHPVEMESMNDNSIEICAFNKSVNVLCKRFLSKRAMLLSELFKVYLDEIESSKQKADTNFNDLLKTKCKKQFLDSLHESLRHGLVSDLTVERVGTVLLWAGYDKGMCIANVLGDTLLEKSSYEEQVSLLKQRDVAESTTNEADKSMTDLDQALTTLRGYIEADSKIICQEISDNKIDLTVDFIDFIQTKSSKRLWNFLSLLSMSKTSFKTVKAETRWNDFCNIPCGDCCKKDVNFLKTFYQYSHVLYSFSSGKCNQPLHIMLSDILDRYTNGSSQCIQIFNSLGIVAGNDTLQRFQTKIGQEHANSAPFNDISRGSFYYASLDNLDFFNKHAKIRASGQKRCINCTTYMAGQPQPIGLKTDEQGETESSEREIETSRNRSRKRKIDNPNYVAPHHIALPLITEEVTPLQLIDFDVSSDELDAARVLKKDLFVYNVIKNSRVNNNSKFYPCLKVFLGRKDRSETEKSLKSYLGIIDEPCDSLETVSLVLKDMHKKMEVGVNTSHLVVVGDGLTFDHLVQLKKEEPAEHQWMLPFLGDWHILKNFARALMTVYGPAGLTNLITLFHKGATENAIINSSDFEKTLSFLLQVWEAMHRLQIKMYLENKEKLNGQLATPPFSVTEFLSNIADMTQNWGEMNLDADKYEQSFLSASDELGDLYGDFQEYLAHMCNQSESFKFWNNFIHRDCLAYIGLYLANRSGNWNLRLHSLKTMLPLFFAVPSHYYFKHLPQHIADLQKFPKDILHNLQCGGFTMNQSGTKWSNLCLDEMHERSINKELKGAINSLSLLSMNQKLHFMTYRASVHAHMLDALNISSNKKMLSNDSKSYAKLQEENILAYQNKLADSALFKEGSSPKLQHIFSYEIASDIINTSLSTFYQVGEERYVKHVKCFFTHEITLMPGQKRPYTFSHLINFGHSNKQKRAKPNENYYKAKAEFQAKYLDWCYANNVPPDDIMQFITLPLALATIDGLPIQKSKSEIIIRYLLKNFSQAFIQKLPRGVKTFHLDTMVDLYNLHPLSCHHTFEQYAAYLFRKLVLEKFHFKGYEEIHVCFDSQYSDLETPKSILRKQRDNVQEAEGAYQKIDKNTPIPIMSWAKLLGNRTNKRLIVEFICDYFITLGQRILIENQSLIVSGGFPLTEDKQNVAKIVSPANVQNLDEDPILLKYSNNHIEGDTLVWLHATQCDDRDSPIVISSTDTDVIQIGLAMAAKYPDKHFIVQYKKSEFVDLKELLSLLSKKADLEQFNANEIAGELLSLFACSGCDYVSFFNHHSKVMFYKEYFNHIQFISGNQIYPGSLRETSDHNWNTGFLAFCRLVGCVFMKNNASLFASKLGLSKTPSPEDLYKHIAGMNQNKTPTEITLLWLEEIRSVTRTSKKNRSEEFWLPSDDSLKLHWQRSCYVVQVWKQADKNIIRYPIITDWGWSRVENSLAFKWDSIHNIKKVEKYRKLWSSGCQCKSAKACSSKNCGCQKQNKRCGPACSCPASICNNKPLDPTISALLSELGDEAELRDVETLDHISTDELHE